MFMIVVILPIIDIALINIIIAMFSKKSIKMENRIISINKIIEKLKKENFLHKIVDNLEMYEKIEKKSNTIITNYVLAEISEKDENQINNIEKISEHFKREVEKNSNNEYITKRNYIICYSKEYIPKIEEIQVKNTILNLNHIGADSDITEEKDFVLVIYLVEKEQKVYMKRLYSNSLFSLENFAYEKLKAETIDFLIYKKED
ncbi:MAG: hypothetical protein ACI4XM_06920 [Candidatus Coprovivens sp.]